jgi:hypothetical protein
MRRLIDCALGWFTGGLDTADLKEAQMLFSHLKRVLKLDRFRLRGPNGARDKFHLPTTAQNLRKLAMLVPPAPPLPAG